MSNFTPLSQSQLTNLENVEVKPVGIIYEIQGLLCHINLQPTVQDLTVEWILETTGLPLFMKSEERKKFDSI